MLHRLTLRVLPRLTLAVTEESVRKRKRLVMLVPGLVAFAVYRLVKQVHPLSDPWVLLALSGLLSAATALAAYRVGCGVPWGTIWAEDGVGRLGWLAGWIGLAYGVQLSLMVLALLKLVVQYDFLRHPDGPAMMAVLIAVTSVARDAFEIGYVRRLQRRGESVLTFPDGDALRALLREQPLPALWWAGGSATGAGFVALAARFVEVGRSDLAQLILVSLVAGSLAVGAYLAGERRPGGWRAVSCADGWTELFRFWWWPGLAFAATYYLALTGGATFLLHLEEGHGLAQGVIAATVGGLMALDCYYLGHRRFLENRIQQMVPTSLLRCPFVLGILSKSGVGAAANGTSLQETEVAVGEARRRG